MRMARWPLMTDQTPDTSECQLRGGGGGQSRRGLLSELPAHGTSRQHPVGRCEAGLDELSLLESRQDLLMSDTAG